MKRHFLFLTASLFLLVMSTREAKAEIIKIYSETAELIDHTSYAGGTYGWWQLRENNDQADIYYSFGTVYGTTRVVGEFTLANMDCAHDEWGWTYLYDYNTKKRIYFNSLKITGYAYNNGYHYLGKGECTDGNTYEFDIYTEGTEDPGGHDPEQKVTPTTKDGFFVWVEGSCTCYKMTECPRLVNEGGFTNIYVASSATPVLSLPLAEGSQVSVSFGDYVDITGIEAVDAEKTPVRKSGKYISGGKLIIINNGKQYDISGKLIK